MKWTISAAFVMLLAVAAIALIPTAPVSEAFTVKQSNFTEANFDPIAGLSANGRQLTASGHYTCQGEAPGQAPQTVRIEVTITQNAFGAVGTSYTDVPCSGTNLPWTATIIARNPARFEAGAAGACGDAVIPGTASPLFHWCRASGVTLAPAS